MSVEGQTLAALGLVLLCAAWVGWRFLRPFVGNSGCAGGCGCAANTKSEGELIQIQSAAGEEAPEPPPGGSDPARQGRRERGSGIESGSGMLRPRSP